MRLRRRPRPRPLMCFGVLYYGCSIPHEECSAQSTSTTGGSEMGASKFTVLVALTAGVALASGAAFAQAGGGGGGGNGNGGSGGGNAHGAATAAPTVGGDNTSAPGSTHKGGFHFKHKKKAKPV